MSRVADLRRNLPATGPVSLPLETVRDLLDVADCAADYHAATICEPCAEDDNDRYCACEREDGTSCHDAEVPTYNALAAALARLAGTGGWTVTVTRECPLHGPECGDHDWWLGLDEDTAPGRDAGTPNLIRARASRGA